MSITAKELANKLNLSATAVSMALNNRPGVSTETKQKILQAAEQYGYDFSKLSNKNRRPGNIYAIWYRGNNTILSYSPIFDEIMDGIEMECRKQGYQLKIIQFYDKSEDFQSIIETLRVSDCEGLLLLGTELKEEAGAQLLTLKIPVVILDSYFISLNCDYVLINNRQGAYLATDYLIARRRTQPGHLRSSYTLRNFDERNDGYLKAIHDNGMAASQCIVHDLFPSIEGAMADMLEILDSQKTLANCYFADNDLIALGCIKAMKLRGIRIPEDIGIIGFDNISEARIIDPSLTTISIPRKYMAQLATQKLIDKISNSIPFTTVIEVSTTLVKRFSV